MWCKYQILPFESSHVMRRHRKIVFTGLSAMAPPLAVHLPTVAQILSVFATASTSASSSRVASLTPARLMQRASSSTGSHTVTLVRLQLSGLLAHRAHNLIVAFEVLATSTTLSATIAMTEYWNLGSISTNIEPLITSIDSGPFTLTTKSLTSSTVANYTANVTASASPTTTSVKHASSSVSFSQSACDTGGSSTESGCSSNPNTPPPLYYILFIGVPVFMTVACIIIGACWRRLRDRRAWTYRQAQRRYEKAELDAISKLSRTHGRCELQGDEPLPKVSNKLEGHVQISKLDAPIIRPESRADDIGTI